MRRLPKPVDQQGKPFCPTEVFELCLSKVRNSKAHPNLKVRLQGNTTFVTAASKEYEKHAALSSLHLIPIDASGNGVTTDELVSVYTGRMAKQNGTGRDVYDSVLSAPPNGKCPLCDTGVVSTLDHHLPKTRYPLLSVNPSNLVPACTWCQNAKGEAYPSSAGEQTLHPYYDNFENTAWLLARVKRTKPASFEFYVDPSVVGGVIAITRLERHMEVFDLHRLFSSNAGSELSEIRFRLTELFNLGGSATVKDHLVEEARTRRANCINSWRTAMYQAASTSKWFCEHGFSWV